MSIPGDWEKSTLIAARIEDKQAVAALAKIELAKMEHVHRGDIDVNKQLELEHNLAMRRLELDRDVTRAASRGRLAGALITSVWWGVVLLVGTAILRC